MDCALLIIAANEDCPMPQTKQHLQAMTILGISNVIVIQNKGGFSDANSGEITSWENCSIFERDDFARCTRYSNQRRKWGTTSIFS